MKTLLAGIGSLAAAAAVVLGATACGSEDEAVPLGDPPPQTSRTRSEPTGTVPTVLSLEVWFTRGGQLVRETRTHEKTQRVATAAMEELLAGPTPAERQAGLRSAIPEGTRLLGISIDGGIATADLTSEFEAGGGSASMQARLGQVVYTLTQFPTVQAVRFRLDGTPVDVFSSEGIVLDHAVRRRDYETLLPAIVVAKPAAGSEVASPVTVSGTANVFEANVTIEVLDESGRMVGNTFTTATCGTGCRGAYSKSVSFQVDRAQAGTIVVHDDDAAGTGEPPHEVRVPVKLLAS